jgi:hypothetical protein
MNWWWTPCSLQITPKLRRRDADDAAEDLRESARVGVADFERDLDQAALGFSHHLLGADDALAGDELQRTQASRSLELAREVERAQLDQAGQRFDRDLFGQPFADVVFHFVELADGQAAADLGALAELGRALGVAGDQWLGRGRDEKAIDHPRQPAEPHIQPSPIQRGAVGQHFTAEVAVKGASGGAVGCFHDA